MNRKGIPEKTIISDSLKILKLLSTRVCVILEADILKHNAYNKKRKQDQLELNSRFRNECYWKSLQNRYCMYDDACSCVKYVDYTIIRCYRETHLQWKHMLSSIHMISVFSRSEKTLIMWKQLNILPLITIFSYNIHSVSLHRSRDFSSYFQADFTSNLYTFSYNNVLV